MYFQIPEWFLIKCIEACIFFIVPLTFFFVACALISLIQILYLFGGIFNVENWESIVWRAWHVIPSARKVQETDVETWVNKLSRRRSIVTSRFVFFVLMGSTNEIGQIRSAIGAGERGGSGWKKKKKEKTGFDFHSSVKKERPAFRLR